MYLRIRRESGFPDLGSEVLRVFLLLIGLIAVSLILAPEGEDLDYQFIEEDGLNTVLSSFSLAAAATFAFASSMFAPSKDKTQVRMWWIFAAGFAYLSIDEVFQIHEQIGWFLHTITDSGPFRNWNDVVVITYGLLALTVLWFVLPEVLKHDKMPELFALGFVCYLVHTMTDSLVEDATVTSIVIEESYKLACNFFLATGTYFGLKSVFGNRVAEKSAT